MPNVCLAVGLRLTVLFLVFSIGTVPAVGQLLQDNPYNARSSGFGYSPSGLRDLGEFPWNYPQSSPQLVPAGPTTVSAEALRHPLSSKARHLLQKAMHLAELGNHIAAIEGLREAHAKFPLDAPYADNLLGLEYLKTNQFTDAKNSFEEAARLMPNESGNHSNFGLALAIAGEWDSAEREERKALELDSANSKAKTILKVLQMRKRTQTAEPRP